MSLGHAFGLSHPGGRDVGLGHCDAGSLMWGGFFDYTEAHLTDVDKDKLRETPFIEYRHVR